MAVVHVGVVLGGVVAVLGGVVAVLVGVVVALGGVPPAKEMDFINVYFPNSFVA